MLIREEGVDTSTNRGEKHRGIYGTISGEGEDIPEGLLNYWKAFVVIYQGNGMFKPDPQLTCHRCLHCRF